MDGKSEDQSRISDWHASLPQKAVAIAKEADKDPDLKPQKLLKLYLANPTLIEAFGELQARKPEFSSNSEFGKWYEAIWGRRCGYYLGAISRGLSEYAEVDKNVNLLPLTERVSQNASKLRREFRRTRRKNDTLVRSLLDLEHGITNFHRTYLDPVLFSVLVSLAFAGHEFPSKYAGTPEYDDLGIHNQDELDDLRKELLTLARSEVSLYTLDGKAKSEVLADESTLWWGVYELIRDNGDKFYIGNEPNRCGMHVAARFVTQLATWTRDSPAYPNSEMARSEATPEIHCPLRTQLLIAFNGFNLLNLQWPETVIDDVRLSLNELIDWSLGEALASWEDNLQLQEHAYFIGLALEVLSHRQKVLSDLDRIQRPKSNISPIHPTYSALYTGQKEFRNIDDATYRKIMNNKKAFKVLILDRGEYEGGNSAGSLWIKGHEVLRRSDIEMDRRDDEEFEDYVFLEPLLYKILFRMLLQNGVPMTIPDLIEACWSNGRRKAASLRKLIEETEAMRDDEEEPDRYRKAKEEIEKATNPVRSATDRVEDILKPAGVSLRTHGQGKYSLNPLPEYCIIRIGF